jgi:hypothetical protein
MRHNRLLPTILFALCFAAAAHAQQQPQAQVCTLTVEQAPELRGFRLGMSLDQVKTRIPNIQVRQLEFGLSDASASNLDAALYKGVVAIGFDFLDDRLVSLHVYYESVPWKSADQFAARVSESLKLPDAWKTSQGWSKDLKCAGFDVVAQSSPTVITLSVPGYNEILKQRRAQHEEQLRQSFRP